MTLELTQRQLTTVANALHNRYDMLSTMEAIYIREEKLDAETYCHEERKEIRNLLNIIKVL